MGAKCIQVPHFHGTLEGVESTTNSPGLGLKKVQFVNLPTIGISFQCVVDEAEPPANGFSTSQIVEGKLQEDDSIQFKTRNTTYVLRVEGRDVVQQDLLKQLVRALGHEDPKAVN